MKLAEIEIGGRYTAKVSGRVQVVRILAVRTSRDSFRGRDRTVLDAVNEATGQRITIRSPQRLRSRVE